MEDGCTLTQGVRRIRMFGLGQFLAGAIRRTESSNEV